MRSILIVFASSLFSLNAFSATEVHCVATNVYLNSDSELKGKFDIASNLSANAEIANLGSASFSVSEGDRISLKTKGDYTSVILKSKGSSEAFKIRFNNKTKLGELTLESWDLSQGIAKIQCL